MALSLVACCCLAAAYRPPVTPNVQAAARHLAPRALHSAAPLHSAQSFDGEQAVPNPETTAAGDLAAPPGPHYVPRVVCTAIARLGGGVELIGKAVERVSVDAGHCPQDEAPEAVNAALVEWMRRLPE